jgi:hypothetical protein
MYTHILVQKIRRKGKIRGSEVEEGPPPCEQVASILRTILQDVHNDERVRSRTNARARPVLNGKDNRSAG